MRLLIFLLFFLSSLPSLTLGTESLPKNTIYLRDNLKRAQKGDYIVTMQSKSYTLLHIYNKGENELTIEEITVPTSRIDTKNFSWKEWVKQGAPYNTAWVMYVVNLNSGQMRDFFSFTKNEWCDLSKADNFLSTLLNLRLQFIPPSERRKVGPPPPTTVPDRRRLWQPQMVVDGQTVEGVAFDAWRTHWPKDGGQLSGKLIEVFVPEENDKYPSYFPYWLQISGLVGKAKVRIIDSGTALESPMKPPGYQQFESGR